MMALLPKIAHQMCSLVRIELLFALYHVSTPATWHSQMSFCLKEFSEDIAWTQSARYVA